VRLWILGCIVLVIAGSSASGAPEDPGKAAIAVREVFRTRCAGCHAANKLRPAGNFGYVLDLRRVANNPEMVVAGKPDESELLQLVKRNEMPPSPAKPLSPEEKDAIHAWIVAGAPPLPPGAELASDTSSGPPDDIRRILAGAGKFHLLLLHFPVALLIVAALADLWASARKEPGPSAAVRFCVVLGAAAAVPTALLGWAYALAGHGTSQPATLMWHRWLGTGVAVWAVATAVVVERGARQGKHGSVGQLMVLLGAFLVGAAAHFGGTLIHGDILLSW
jgi:mono/diheme cytochrome c family protein